MGKTNWNPSLTTSNMMNRREPSTIPEAWEWNTLEIVKNWLRRRDKRCKKSMEVQNAACLTFFKSLKKGRNVTMLSDSGKNCWLTSHPQGKIQSSPNSLNVLPNFNIPKFTLLNLPKSNIPK